MSGGKKISHERKFLEKGWCEELGKGPKASGINFKKGKKERQGEWRGKKGKDSRERRTRVRYVLGGERGGKSLRVHFMKLVGGGGGGGDFGC